MSKVRDSIQKNLRSYSFAFKGLTYLFKENNFRIHLLVAVVVIALGIRFGLSQGEWLIILLCIGMVLCAEAMNTAIEKLCDHLHPEQHPNIGKVKDIAAAGVLITAVISAVIGAVVFWTYISQQ